RLSRGRCVPPPAAPPPSRASRSNSATPSPIRSTLRCSGVTRCLNPIAQPIASMPARPSPAARAPGDAIMAAQSTAPIDSGHHLRKLARAARAAVRLVIVFSLVTLTEYAAQLVQLTLRPVKGLGRARRWPQVSVIIERAEDLLDL